MSTTNVPTTTIIKEAILGKSEETLSDSKTPFKTTFSDANQEYKGENPLNCFKVDSFLAFRGRGWAL